MTVSLHQRLDSTAWVAVGVSFLVLSLLGLRQTFPVFYLALVEQFGWSRAATSGVYALTLIFGTLLGPVIGGLVDRYGARIMVAGGGVLFALTLFASSYIQELWQFYVLFGVVNSIATALIMLGTLVLIGNSFPNRRGKAVGFAYAGITFGPMLFVPLSEYIIRTSGWRWAYIALGALAMLIVPLGFLLPVGQLKASKPARANDQVDLGRYFRSGNFWLMVGACFAASTIDLAFFQHMYQFFVNAGQPEQVAATLLSLLSFGYFLGQIGGGIGLDRFGRVRTGILGGLIVLIGIGIMLFAPSSMLAYLVPLLGGAGVGVIINVRTATVGDLFAGPHLGKIIGLTQTASAVGASLITWYGGFEFDLYGQYTGTFTFAALTACIWIGMIWLMTTRPWAKMNDVGYPLT